MTQLRQEMLEELQGRRPEQIRQYQAHLFQAKKLAPATISQYVSALRLLFIKTLRCHFLAEYIPFPKSCKRSVPAGNTQLHAKVGRRTCR